MMCHHHHHTHNTRLACTPTSGVTYQAIQCACWAVGVANAADVDAAVSVSATPRSDGRDTGPPAVCRARARVRGYVIDLLWRMHRQGARPEAIWAAVKEGLAG